MNTIYNGKKEARKFRLMVIYKRLIGIRLLMDDIFIY